MKPLQQLIDEAKKEAFERDPNWSNKDDEFLEAKLWQVYRAGAEDCGKAITTSFYCGECSEIMDAKAEAFLSTLNDV